MPVKFQNLADSFRNQRGKPIYVPNEKGYEVGDQLKGLVEGATKFDDFFFHLRRGGHVAALHEHRRNRYFARVDLKNFFYSISRNRVARALHEIGISKAGFYAKFSCVKNPYGEPTYAPPYGFVQSPVLATLVLSRSVLGSYLREIRTEVTLSVYMDDIAISSPNAFVLGGCFEELKAKILEANFPVNTDKTASPANLMEVFNCELKPRRTSVTEARRETFYSRAPSGASREAIANYCRSIEDGNEL